MGAEGLLFEGTKYQEVYWTEAEKQGSLFLDCDRVQTIKSRSHFGFVYKY